jgi:hypothetical protein
MVLLNQTVAFAHTIGKSLFLYILQFATQDSITIFWAKHDMILTLIEKMVIGYGRRETMGTTGVRQSQKNKSSKRDNSVGIA